MNFVALAIARPAYITICGSKTLPVIKSKMNREILTSMRPELRDTACHQTVDCSRGVVTQFVFRPILVLSIYQHTTCNIKPS